jgi:hypothetical protein
MKIKLATLLAFILIGLAGCTPADNSNSTAPKNINAGNVNAANKTSSTETPKAGENTVVASANPTDEVGGTKEGCKCSATGMKCSTKPGEKGCCGKGGECSTMVEGKSSCCASKGKEGEACCSTAGKMAMNDGKETNGKEKMGEMSGCGPEKKPAATAPAKKS